MKHEVKDKKYIYKSMLFPMYHVFRMTCSKARREEPVKDASQVLEWRLD